MKIVFIISGVISSYFWAFDIFNISHVIAGLWRSAYAYEILHFTIKFI